MTMETSKRLEGIGEYYFSQKLREIDGLNNQGKQIINLGIVPFEESLRQTAQSEYCIFPSLKETFGLGLIEGALINHKVLAADLDYTYEVLEPSLVFSPHDPKDMANKVQICISKQQIIKQAIPKIDNQIEELIAILTTK